MKLFVKGDIDGFFGLALDNLVQVLLIESLLTTVLGFPRAFVYGRVLPGVAVSLIFGNLFYSWQARKLAEKTGRKDHCALPYGINTVSLFGYVFLVMLPAKLSAEAAGMSEPYMAAWKAGLVACAGSGIIEFSGAFVAEKVRRATPRAALLSTLSGIALGFISLGFLFRTFAHPVVGLVTLAIILLTYFGRVKFLFGLPGGLVAVSAGIILSWITGLAPSGVLDCAPGIYLPVPALRWIVEALSGNYILPYISIIIPMGLFNLVGSLQNIESAEAAGDSYPTAPSLAVNGLGTLAAAFFGSCFPTTLYIGHPGWKSLGARAGYSLMNGVFFTAVCFTGTFSAIAWAVPVDAGMAIVLWIGIVISAQAFSATPREHAPAVVVGILPSLAAWGAMMSKTGLRAGGFGTAANPFSEKIVDLFHASDTWIDGVFALEQGFIFSAMILSAMTVFVIEKKFVRAGVAAFIGAAVCLTGIMHSYAFGQTDTVMKLSPHYKFFLAYTAMGLIFVSARWFTKSEKEDSA